MDNADIARTLNEMADVLELTGGNAFKVRAYRQAAEVVDLLPQPAGELCAQGKLIELPGIGTRIAEHIAELCARGEFREHEQLKKDVPRGVLEILAVEGVGPKTAAAVWKTLGVTDLEGLEAACSDKRLLTLRAWERHAVAPSPTRSAAGAGGRDARHCTARSRTRTGSSASSARSRA